MSFLTYRLRLWLIVWAWKRTRVMIPANWPHWRPLPIALFTSASWSEAQALRNSPAWRLVYAEMDEHGDYFNIMGQAPAAQRAAFFSPLIFRGARLSSATTHPILLSWSAR